MVYSFSLKSFEWFSNLSLRDLYALCTVCNLLGFFFLLLVYFVILLLIYVGLNQPFWCFWLLILLLTFLKFDIGLCFYFKPANFLIMLVWLCFNVGLVSKWTRIAMEKQSSCFGSLLNVNEVVRAPLCAFAWRFQLNKFCSFRLGL